MAKIRRTERMVALTKILMDQPYQMFSLTYFSQLFGTAKSTISEDLMIIKGSLQSFAMGILETVPGAAGGVRYVPRMTMGQIADVLNRLCLLLTDPARIIAGGFLYMSDLLFSSHYMTPVGEIFMSCFEGCRPDMVVTIETKGIPLAMMTARAFHVPLVVVRHGSRVTEGPAVSMNYLSGSSRRIQTMSVPKRALPSGSRVLIIDDFMKAGGTAKGLSDLVQEMGADVVGTGVLVSTADPQNKLISDYTALLVMEDVDELAHHVCIAPHAWVQKAQSEDVSSIYCTTE